MIGNIIKTKTHKGIKYKVVDKVLTWRWVQKAKDPMNYALVQEDKYLCTIIGNTVGLNQGTEPILINPKDIKEII